MQVSTGIGWLDKILLVAGALYVLLSTILVFIPKSSRMYSPIAIFVADLKALLSKSNPAITPLPIIIDGEAPPDTKPSKDKSSS